VRLGDGSTPARVVDVVFAGTSVRYWLELTPNVTIIAEQAVSPGERFLEIGSTTTVAWETDAALVFAA
jgi:hypothetical protein